MKPLLFSVAVFCSLICLAAGELLIHLPYDNDTSNLGSTGMVNDGTLGGDAALVVAGKLGSAVVMDGVGDYVDHGGLADFWEWGADGVDLDQYVGDGATFDSNFWDEWKRGQV